MIIKIDALDTLFFRDGKPFTIGGDTWGSGIFPPYPSMLYGALRSLYFSQNIDELKNAAPVGETNTNDPTANLVIKGLYLQRAGLIFPVPLDCVKVKKSKKKILTALNPMKSQSVSNCKTEVILRPANKEEVENVEDGWIDSSTLKEYLDGNYKNMSYQELSDFVLSEPKIGIGRNDKTHTAEDSMLYRAGMKRLIDTSIIVEIEGLDKIPDKGVMKIGGEGRPVSFTCITDDKLKVPEPPEEINNKKIKLYLATPAIFKKGWLPDAIDENNLTGEINGIKLKLITAAIGRPVYIGGFDIKNGPKPMKRAVPAGSVYYFEVQDESSGQDIINALQNKAISDEDKYKKQGFGIAYLGRWQ